MKIILYIHHAVDETRVRLKGVEGSDYINASFIDVSTATIVCRKSVPLFDYYRDIPTKTMPT